MHQFNVLPFFFRGFRFSFPLTWKNLLDFLWLLRFCTGCTCKLCSVFLKQNIYWFTKIEYFSLWFVSKKTLNTYLRLDIFVVRGEFLALYTHTFIVFFESNRMIIYIPTLEIHCLLKIVIFISTYFKTIFFNANNNFLKNIFFNGFYVLNMFVLSLNYLIEYS